MAFSELSYVRMINAAKLSLPLIGKNSSDSDEYADFNRSFEAFDLQYIK